MLEKTARASVFDHDVYTFWVISVQYPQLKRAATDEMARVPRVVGADIGPRQVVWDDVELRRPSLEGAVPH